MQVKAPPDQTESSTSYRTYVLVMLTLVYAFNFIDRQVLVILQEAIKRDMHLSDAQLGWLSGAAFAAIYVTVGIPVARLADKGSRRNIVAISLGVWSIMTAACGMARNYLQLLFARVGVGIGEAGGSPPAHAMISDYFAPGKRSTALAIYSAGIYLGMLIGFAMGGYLSQHVGWRKAFMVVGAPGVIFSLLFYATVKEPRRGATDASQAAESHGFWEVVKLLFSSRTFVYLAMATSLLVFCIYGMSNWASSFLARLHGMKTAQIGIALGLAFGIGGGIGSFGGGWLTDRFGKTDKSWYLKIPAFAILLSILFEAIALFTPDTTLSVIAFGGVAALHSMYLGPSLSVAHSLVPASMRALTSAVLFFCLNLIGLGLGPPVVGAIADKLKPSLGVESLRWAMSGVMLVSAAAMVLFFKTAGVYRAAPPSMVRQIPLTKEASSEAR
ncbi:MAG TPA: MFS transporter [Puia sp.]|nr:MFS transporter [Puia sp.]